MPGPTLLYLKRKETVGPGTFFLEELYLQFDLSQPCRVFFYNCTYSMNIFPSSVLSPPSHFL